MRLGGSLAQVEVELTLLQQEVALRKPTCHLEAWLPALELMEAASLGGEFVATLLNHAGIHDLLQVLSQKPFGEWPFQQLVLAHAREMCQRYYALATRKDATKLLDRIEQVADVSQAFCVPLLADLVETPSLGWRKAIEDEACLRLPAWRRFSQLLEGFYLQLRQELEENYRRLCSLEFSLADCIVLSEEGPFQAALLHFSVQRPGLSELGGELRALRRGKEKIKCFRTLATWHPKLAQQLEGSLKEVESLELAWGHAPACELRTRCQALLREAPDPRVLKALDMSPIIRTAVLEGMNVSMEVSIPETVEKIRVAWGGEFASLLSRELNLTRAKELLELGRDRQDCKDTAWLALELRVAPSLGNFQQELFDPEHCKRVEADLQAVVHFAGYSTVLSDLESLLTTLQKRSLLIADESLREFEEQLCEHKSLDWSCCQLSRIQRFSKSHVLGLEVESLEAAALHSIMQQVPLIQMLEEGDRQLDFLQDADRFRQLQVMVRESSADFDGFQVAAVQDLDNLRPFLIGVLMPEAHSLSTLLKALKQHRSTPLKLVARASDLLRVVGLLHTDLSKDVRCRDMELFQEMWRDMADQ
ncbi:unnamed protein product [Durusdinium trenchii]